MEAIQVGTTAAAAAAAHYRQNTVSKSSRNICCSTSFRAAVGLSSRNSLSRELWRAVNWSCLGKAMNQSGGGLVIRAEMFGQLTTGLEAAWSKLRGQDFLTKDNIAEPMRDIRRALLEADVSLPVVRRFVQSVSDQAVGVGLIKGVSPDQQLVKIVRDELVKLMGGEVSELVFSKSGPTVILLAGLQGVGKTTVSAKLAFYLKKLGKTCMLIAGDVYRPAAIDQLVILGQQVDVPVYTAGIDIKPSEIAKQGLAEAKKKNVDVVIVDTAGRLQAVTGISLPSASDKLFTSSQDGTIRTWNCHTGECIGVAHMGSPVWCLESEGPWMFAGMTNAVKAWNIKTGFAITLDAPGGHVYSLAFCDKTLFGGLEDGSVFRWKLNSDDTSFEGPTVLEGHTDAVVSLFWGAERVYSGSLDKTVRAWDRESLLCTHTLQKHSEEIMSVLCWETYLLSSSLDKTLKVWGATQMDKIEVIHTHNEDHGILSLSGMHDAAKKPILLCSCSDNSLRLYDLPSFNERGRKF